MGEFEIVAGGLVVGRFFQRAGKVAYGFVHVAKRVVPAFFVRGRFGEAHVGESFQPPVAGAFWRVFEAFDGVEDLERLFGFPGAQVGHAFGEAERVEIELSFFALFTHGFEMIGRLGQCLPGVFAKGLAGFAQALSQREALDAVGFGLRRNGKQGGRENGGQ